MTLRILPKATLNTLPNCRSDIPERAINQWNPDVMASEGESGENTITILDPIGADWYGEGVTAKRISAALRRIGPNPVEVVINSPGGSFFEGLAIYNLLLEHKGEVTVKIIGMAASAASVIAMAADNLLMARASFLMIHNTWVMSAGDQHSFRDVADWLKPFDEAAVDIYHARTSIDRKKISAMLDKETWIGGSSAVDQGFADDLLSSDQVETNAQNATELTPHAAQKKADLLLARSGVTKATRREIFAAMKGGTSRAALSSTSSAAVHEAATRLLTQINNI
ncbi:head maturation protease, ClpP-related [Falsihalocynthiibacter sp. BN13B15]|uniref:head maturation protease, ClpP-related n=1 Tax=Falsihalocynthiibacter sp. BN13B15 TaxID=3240871 RepID=UPI00350E8F3E